MALSGVGMMNASPFLDLSSIDSSLDNGIRSPRTPTYAPTSPSFTSVRPFDPSALFGRISPVNSTKKSRLPTPPPTKPLAWLWQCHLCHSQWPLAATRRCLVDGHFYCSGETDQPNLKKKKKGQSCSSEFDYVGWREWGDWKRKALKAVEKPRIPKRCETCEFPSQCRYSKGADIGTHTTESKKSVSIVDEKDDPSRYYSKTDVTFESLVVEALAESKSSKQSGVTNFYNSDTRAGEKKCEKAVNASTTDKSSRTNGGCSRKKSCLSPIEKEILKAEIGIGLQDLVMPIMDFLNNKSRSSK